MQLTTNAAVLSQIANLQSKILRIQALRALAPFEQVNFFFYSSSGKFLSINENDVPFSLSIEIGLILDASLDHYNIEMKTLENSFPCDK